MPFHRCLLGQFSFAHLPDKLVIVFYAKSLECFDQGNVSFTWQGDLYLVPVMGDFTILVYLMRHRSFQEFLDFHRRGRGTQAFRKETRDRCLVRATVNARVIFLLEICL